MVSRWIQAVKKPEQSLRLLCVTETVINDFPPFLLKKKKRDVQLTDILLIVSANLPCIKGFIGCNASVRKVLFDEMLKMAVLWMKNEGNLSTAIESLGFNNKIKTIVTFPIVLFNHLPPTGPINRSIT